MHIRIRRALDDNDAKSCKGILFRGVHHAFHNDAVDDASVKSCCYEALHIYAVRSGHAHTQRLQALNMTERKLRRTWPGA